jgi:hypothetical protein
MIQIDYSTLRISNKLNSLNLIPSLGPVAAMMTVMGGVMKMSGVKQIKYLLVISLGLVLVGCGSSKKSSGSATGTLPPVGGVNPENPTATWPYTTSGAVARFSPISWEEMNSYVAVRPLNNPSNALVNINMKKVGSTSFYAGKVQIGYTDNGQFYYGTFSVGEGTNVNCSNCLDNGLYEAAPNFWMTINGKRVFMAYLQDQWGSLILVLESETAGADGEAGGLLKGKIYYRNFAQSLYPQSTYRKCWYIYAGPYACYSNKMSQKLSSEDFSDGNYRLLGSFSGVRRDQALGQ